MPRKVYSTGSTQGSRIPYPGGIPAPDMKMITSRIRRAAEGSTEDHLNMAIARAVASIATPDTGPCAGRRDMVKVDSDGSVSFDEAPFIKCCSETWGESLCRAALKDAKVTLAIANEIPGVGHLFSWVAKVGKKKRQAWSLNKKKEFAKRIKEYLRDELFWVEANALIELGYADLLAFLSDCRPVTTKGVYNTKGGRGRDTHRAVPYMKWHGSEGAKQEFEGWLGWLRWKNRSRYRVRRSSSLDGRGGRAIGHNHAMQDWLLQHCVPTWSGTRHCINERILTPALAGDRCFPGSAPRGAAFKMWPAGLLEAAGQYDYMRSRESVAVRRRLENSKTVKDMCKSGLGWARYRGGSWYETGSVRRGGHATTPAACVSEIANDLAYIGSFKKYQGRGGVKDPRAAKAWINAYYAKELAFIRRLDMSGSQAPPQVGEAWSMTAAEVKAKAPKKLAIPPAARRVGIPPPAQRPDTTNTAVLLLGAAAVAAFVVLRKK